MAGKIATRAAYGEALVELAEQYPELVVFDADLSNATMTKGFAAKYPERFFDMGIAECNMTGVAAGMSTCGFKPFTNTFAIFASGRAWEQVRNSIGYPHLNVKVVGSHGGLSVGEDGATHQCTEDLALMRVIPGMKVLCPCDGYEMKLAVKALLEYDGPAYLRLGRAAVETVTDEIEGYRFELDKGVTLKDGKDVTVIEMLPELAMASAYAPQLALMDRVPKACTVHTSCAVTQISSGGRRRSSPTQPVAQTASSASAHPAALLPHLRLRIPRPSSPPMSLQCMKRRKPA